MKLLLISDEEDEYLWDHYQPGRLAEYDMILSAGDLKAEYLSFLVTMGNLPVVYVHGNHDGGYDYHPPEGCDCADDVLLNVKCLLILGLGGSMWYNGGPYQYTEQEMEKRVKRVERKIRKAGGVDIIITHAPPRGYGDAEDNAHRGFACFLPLLDKYHPRYLIHGHVHQSYGHSLPRQIQYGETTVFNAVGYHILDIDPLPDQPKPKKRFLFW